MSYVEIPGFPIAFARPGQTPGGRRYTPASYAEWKQKAVAHMRLVNRVPRIGIGPVRAVITVHSDMLAISLEATEEPTRPKGIRGDLDNYVKAALDAAQDAAWITDDRQVTQLFAEMSSITKEIRDGD